MPFEKITIVGVGLLGGSVGLAVRERGLAAEVAGYVRRRATAAECEKAGALDYAVTDLQAAVSGADLVILCTPLAQMGSLARQFIPALKRGAIVTDVGSVKAGVVRELEPLIARAGAHFIGSHPMAGSEKSGVLAARADLFEKSVCIVTPTGKSNPAALRKVEAFWRGLGSRVLRMATTRHDTLVSHTSHLPHVAAAALVNLVLDPAGPRDRSTLCATGFRDATRIASGSPEMWTNIALSNRRHITRAINAFTAELARFQAAVAKGDARAVEKFFATAKGRRDDWCVKAAATSTE